MQRRPRTATVTIAAVSASALALVAAAVSPAAAVPAVPAVPSTRTYDVVGWAHVAATDTTLAVHRTQLTAAFSPSGAFTGQLPVPSTTAHFTLLGQPAVATVTFVAVGKLTGSEFPTASGTALTGTGRYVMELSRLTSGSDAIDLGSHCRTTTAVTMSASTAAGMVWDDATGGTLSGTFTIPGWKTCNGYERAIDTTISGAGNRVTLRLTPPTT